jgi:hypothetical protein
MRSEEGIPSIMSFTCKDKNVRVPRHGTKFIEIKEDVMSKSVSDLVHCHPFFFRVAAEQLLFKIKGFSAGEDRVLGHGLIIVLFCKHRKGHGGCVSMREADVNMLAAEVLQEALGIYIELCDGLVSISVGDGHGFPTEVFADTNGEGLGNGFLGCKACSQGGVGILFFQAVFLLLPGINFIDKMLAVSIVGIADSRNLNKVTTNTEDFSCGRQIEWNRHF